MRTVRLQATRVRVRLDSLLLMLDAGVIDLCHQSDETLQLALDPATQGSKYEVTEYWNWISPDC
jgi:hypothetical protein